MHVAFAFSQCEQGFSPFTFQVFSAYNRLGLLCRKSAMNGLHNIHCIHSLNFLLLLNFSSFCVLVFDLLFLFWCRWKICNFKVYAGRQVPIFSYFSQHTPIFPIFLEFSFAYSKFFVKYVVYFCVLVFELLFQRF